MGKEVVFDFSSLSAEQRRQVIDLAAASKDETALVNALKDAGYQIPEEVVAGLFKRVNMPPPLSNLSDDELENVSGGCGCSYCENCSHTRPD